MPAIADFKFWGGSCAHCGGEMGAVSPKHLRTRKFCSSKCAGAARKITYTEEELKEQAQAALRRRYAEQHNNPSKYIWALINRKGRKHLKLEDMLALLEEQKGLCALSGVPLTFIKIVGEEPTITNLSIDRRDSTKGYEMENIQLVCTIANKMKSNLSEEDFYWWCAKIVEGLS